MITHIKGTLVEKTPTYVVIDCNGVGYLINISLNTFSKIPSGDTLSLFTFLQVKEDSHTLFGFFDKFERDIFTFLISVSGVGASTARVMLSSLSPEQIQKAILDGDSRTIQSIKGIGAKTSGRIILELRDKIAKADGGSADKSLSIASSSSKEEALEALEVLGYQRKSCQRLVEKILDSNPLSSSEDIIKQVLRLMN